MKISLAEARTRLGKVGIVLGEACRLEHGGASGYQVTTPVGTQLLLQSQEVAQMLRDLNKLSIPA